MKIRILILFAFFCLAEQLFAQTEDSDIFYDSNLYKKNILKIELVSTYLGDFAILYERSLLKDLSCEFGIGFKTPINSQSNIGFRGAEEMISYWLRPKFFLPKNTGLHGGYLSILLRSRNFVPEFSNSQKTYNDLIPNIGYQILISNIIAFDVNIGAGLRRESIVKRFEKTSAVFNFGLSFGFTF